MDDSEKSYMMDGAAYFIPFKTRTWGCITDAAKFATSIPMRSKIDNYSGVMPVCCLL